MRIGRWVALVSIAGMLLAASMLTPAGAHIGTTVGHLWRQHLLPLTKGVFFTKSLANERFLSPGEETRKFVWRVASDADTPLTTIFNAWDLEISASCVSGDVHAEVDAVSEHGTVVGSFVDNFGGVNLIRNTDWDVSSGVVELNGPSNFPEAGGSFTYTSVSNKVVTVQYELSNDARGTDCLVSGLVHRVA